MSSGKPKASGSKKGGTQSKRNHSFQSFTQKIANLKIDPVRRVRRHVDDEETEKSFFHSSLESWVDLNLSTTFTEFSREAIPLSESLPHILHYKDELFELLVKYIDRRDALALEPLLSLLSQFAHDLGATFEPYFARSVTLLGSLVAKHADVSTIEWTFNCLAYLLKYLSRLLVPDLRPLFDILAPLLGREQQKTFITRFAAEALSFLLRKAKEEPLRLIIRHVFEDLIKCGGNHGEKGYRQGLMNMFQESCVSVDRTLHSKGPQILRTMLDISLELSDTSGPCFSVCEGVLISLMHHTTPETFQPALTVVYEFLAELLDADSVTPKRVRMAATLLYTVVTVRKGCRIMDWQKTAIAAAYILEVGTSLKEEEQTEELKEAVWEALKASAMILQQADLEIVISRCGKVVDKARDFQKGILFLPFCDFFSAMGSERFKIFLLPYFQRFILSQWNSHSSALSILIPRLATTGSLTPSKDQEVSTLDILGPKSPLTIAAQTAIRDLDNAIESSNILDSKSPEVINMWKYLDVLLSLPHTIPADSIESLGRLLQKILPTERSVIFTPLIGKALSIYARGKGTKTKSLVGSTCKAFPKLGDNMIFLQGVVDFALVSIFKESIDEEYMKEMVTKLITNLLLPSHEVRTSSLRCLEILYAYKNPTSQVSEIINTAKLIEDTPLAINNARTISMYIRRLGIEYPSVSKDSWERRIVPYYCFGLLTLNFAPAWDDSALVLAKVAEVEEELVAQLAFSWLSLKSEGEDVKSEAPVASNPWTSYECSNMRVVEVDSKRCMTENIDASIILASVFEKELHMAPLSAVTARTQALKVLCEIPRIAEKRGRQLVPMFLEWTRMDDGDVAEEEEVPGEKLPMKWSRKDRAAMLKLFAKFVNPRSLFKSELVYSALLNLLASGDVTSQTLALKCVFTWKIPAIRVYEDNLNNLLDDTHFREEVTKFVQVEEEESMIQTNHRKELMPVLLRILYGRSLSRKNASSGKKGMVSKRTVVLASLANFQPQERDMYIDIALGELAEAKFIDKSDPERYALRPDAIGSVHVSTRKQVGFVRMVEDMMKQLGSTMFDYIPKVMDALLYCLVSAAKNIGEATVEQPTYEDSVSLKVSKAIRQGGFKSLIALFTNCPNFRWAPYIPALFQELVEPRLENLPVETSQGLSGLLQLLFTWTKARSTVLFLSDYNNQVLPKIAQCLASKQVKDEVVLFILNLVGNIVAFVNPEEDMEVEDNSQAVKERLIRPNVDLFIVNTGEILHKSPGKEVLEQAVETIAAIAPYVSGDTETTHLVDISVFMLDQPSRRVSPKAKSEILKILVHFLPLCVMEKSDDLFERTFHSIASLFGFFKDREGRENLAKVLNVFAERDDEMIEVATLSKQLNSWSKERMNEPDFEQRLEAYAKINEERYKVFTPRQWMPLLFNMLFFIKDNELVIRTNASYALRRFVESVGTKFCTPDEEAYLTTLSGTVMPALRAGTREKSELVRTEFVGVMAHIVKECGSWEEVSDMKPLLFGEDEEASFFNNILHIQQHRRLRALRRLAAAAEKEHIQSSNIAHFFLPLIEHFIFDMAEDGHNLASETVITVGALVKQLSWSQYRAVFRRYTGYLKTKAELEKIVVRLIGIIVESLSKTWETAPTNPSKSRTTESAAITDGDGDVSMVTTLGQLAESLPEQDTLAKDISNGFLPTLNDYLHQKDESTVSLRVPIAVSIVKLLKVMPEDMLKLRLPAVLTDVSHILRSRAQDSRDMTRRTLTEITTLLGSQYFGFVIKELRGALLRGYQLHVLSYTVHSILVSVVPSYAPGDLDYCVSQIVDVAMDDIFGVTGMEKDAEGYISKMKEVKSSKSYDSMDLLASTTTLPHLGKLIKPIQSLLQEKMNLKMAKKIDELLRRIGVGLLRNEAVKSQELLVFCYQVIQEAHKATSVTPAEKKMDSTTLRYIVNLKAPSKAVSGVTTSSHTYKLMRFSLDILRTVLQKYEDLKTPELLAGFIPIIGDALLSKQEEIQVSALRLLTTIIRVPLPAIDDGAPVFVQQALSFVKNSPSTNSEIAQASLKLLAAILRERRSFKVKETTIAYLLTRVKPDLEEPDRQGVTFNFLKAVLSRKIVITEVYEVLDNVAAIMVTNQTRTVRDLARGVYFQFLMEYPQGKERLNKQLAFLLKNLGYVHQSGRQSVLEAANLLTTKIGDNLIQDVIATFFVPLVMVLINDDSTECREMAGAIIKKMFERADKERLQTFVGLIRGWLEQDEKTLLVRVALQVYGLYFEVYETKGQKEVVFVTERLQVLLRGACDEENETATEWELVYFGLQTWAKIVQHFPETSFSGANTTMWKIIRDCLVFPHAWAKLSAARLIGLLLAEYAKSSESLANIPLENGRGLSMNGVDMVNIARATLSQLNNAELSDELGLQVVKNLLFMGRCFYANKMAAIDVDVEEDNELNTALLWIIGRVSGIIRSERNVKKGQILGKKYGLQWMAAMVQLITGEDLVPLSNKLIVPLYNLVDSPENYIMKDLKDIAQEILSMMQTKMGPTAYGKAYNVVRTQVKERRLERKSKRTIQMVTDPEKAAKDKIRKNEKKRIARKEKGAVHREQRKGRLG
ncbi:uncharacterized protein LAJ45_01557 [Morchella importuna]|uniref:uncharacterized protein n=1 Tax=Morchella importuna TaxID=1174673 RepID=UPI001E8D7BCA|nr:uncharacterized protein LAJ45_01557 [Morchella importuna]KAH8153790.1 hypothetical protein LAJ45_01557 [Morchella importuna]